MVSAAKHGCQAVIARKAISRGPLVLMIALHEYITAKAHGATLHDQ